MNSESLAAARQGDAIAFRDLVAPHERELRAYCYRMAGSVDEADDLLQETLLRAWRGLPGFEERSSLRTWLYRVTFSVCMDALEKAPRRMLSIDLGPPADADAPFPAPRPAGWIEPCPPALYDLTTSPEARYTMRESVSLAFLAVLQLLPPKQRAAFLAHDVFGFSADECATMLDSTVPAVNSAAQRARETIAVRAPRWSPSANDEETTRALLARYVDAWERADVPALVAILTEEATLAMPPFPLWLRGRGAIGASLAAMVLPSSAAGAFRMRICDANGIPAVVAYRDGALSGIHLLGLEAGRIAAITAFLEPKILGSFGLPHELA